MTESGVAVYWDFENIHAGALELRYGPDYYHKNRYRTQDPVLDIEAIMDYVATLGDIVLNRGYNNWQYFQRYRNALLVHSIDLYQMFPKGANAKNGADIRLALDALDDCRNLSHVGNVVIIGGDSDFISLAQKLRQLGRDVIGIGTQENTNRYWSQSCTEFKFYETIIAPGKIEADDDVTSEIGAPAAPQDLSVAKKLLFRAVSRLAARDSDGVVKAAVRPMMVRIDSEFDPVDFGLRNFNEFLAACSDVIETRKGEFDEMIFLRSTLPTAINAKQSAQHDVYRVIRSAGMVLNEPHRQAVLLKQLHRLLLESQTPLPRKEIVDKLNADALLRTEFNEGELPRSIVSRLVQTASSARCFDVAERGPPVQLKLAAAAQAFSEFRRRHDRNLIYYTLRNGIDLTPAEWAQLLYGDEEKDVDLTELIAELRSRASAPTDTAMALDVPDTELPPL